MNVGDHWLAASSGAPPSRLHSNNSATLNTRCFRGVFALSRSFGSGNEEEYAHLIPGQSELPRAGPDGLNKEFKASPPQHYPATTAAPAPQKRARTTAMARMMAGRAMVVGVVLQAGATSAGHRLSTTATRHFALIRSALGKIGNSTACSSLWDSRWRWPLSGRAPASPSAWFG